MRRSVWALADYPHRASEGPCLCLNTACPRSSTPCWTGSPPSPPSTFAVTDRFWSDTKATIKRRRITRAEFDEAVRHLRSKEMINATPLTGGRLGKLALTPAGHLAQAERRQQRSWSRRISKRLETPSRKLLAFVVGASATWGVGQLLTHYFH